MKTPYGHFRTINIHFENFEERQRALQLLEKFGMPVSDRLKSEASCHPFPQSTHLLHVQLDNRFIHCCPQPFICASIVSSGCRIFTVPEFERIADCIDLE